MQSSEVDPRRERHQFAPAQAELFLSLPPEIYPKLYQHLSGLDVLRFARICKTAEMHCQHLRQAWADQELDRIILLAGEERWTRFLNLIANCGSVIAPDRWRSFLAEVAKQSEEQAALLQLAALSPIRGNASHKLISAVHLEEGIENHAGGKALWKLISNAYKYKWMARPACAAVTGLWRYQCSGGAYFNPYFLQTSFPKMFGSLPLSDQVKNLPHIQADCIQAGRSNPERVVASIRDAYDAVCKAHCGTLHVQTSTPYCIFAFQSQSKSYLTCLTNLFQDTEPMHRLSCEWIRKSVTRSFASTATLLPWREQEAEFTLLVFLALQHGRSGKDADDGLGRRLIAVGFVTAQECMDLFRYVVDGGDDAFHKVQQWLFLNRDRAPEPEPKLSCIIS